LEAQDHVYDQTHEDVQLRIRPFYIPEKSDEKSGVFFYAYQVAITNLAQHQIQLLMRSWTIRNGHGVSENIQGKGVNGQTPMIDPGETFYYSSFCPLATPTGNMRGSYLFKGHRGNHFSVPVPVFFFRKPDTFH